MSSISLVSQNWFVRGVGMCVFIMWCVRLCYVCVFVCVCVCVSALKGINNQWRDMV